MPIFLFLQGLVVNSEKLLERLPFQALGVRPEEGRCREDVKKHIGPDAAYCDESAISR